MPWSWTVGRLAGIELRIHATFLLILAWVALIHSQQGGARGAVAGVLFVLALFACVVLHELGHALAARRYGIATKDITLLPIGGVARLERMPEEPKQEMVVAMAGPMVTLAIAVVLFLVVQVSGQWQDPSQLDIARGSFLERLMLANAVLFVFNLLPAFPMDGGRFLRAALAMRRDYASATRTAAAIGQGMALLFGFLGLMFNPFLVFVALFVWIGAAQEAGAVQTRAVIGGVPVSRAMLTNFRTLAESDPLDRAVDLILSGSQQDFPVLSSDGAVAGVLTRARLFAALAKRSGVQTAGDVMNPDVAAISPRDPLESALLTIQTSGLQTLPVVQEGRLVGMVTAENIAEFLMIQQAKQAASRQPVAGAAN